MQKHFTDERWSDYVRGVLPAAEPTIRDASAMAPALASDAFAVVVREM